MLITLVFEAVWILASPITETTPTVLLGSGPERAGHGLGRVTVTFSFWDSAE